MKLRYSILGILALLILGVAALSFNWYQSNHAGFDQSKWQSDISARRDMLNASGVKIGMTEEQVVQLFGKSELESINKQDETTKVFCYRMPFASQKAVYYVTFKNGCVTEMHVDDSGDVEYQEIEENLKSGVIR